MSYHFRAAMVAAAARQYRITVPDGGPAAPVFTTPASLSLISQDETTATYAVTFGEADSGTVTHALTYDGVSVIGDVADGQVTVTKGGTTLPLVVTSTASWEGTPVVSPASVMVAAAEEVEPDYLIVADGAHFRITVDDEVDADVDLDEDGTPDLTITSLHWDLVDGGDIAIVVPGSISWLDGDGTEEGDLVGITGPIALFPDEIEVEDISLTWVVERDETPVSGTDDETTYQLVSADMTALTEVVITVSATGLDPVEQRITLYDGTAPEMTLVMTHQGFSASVPGGMASQPITVTDQGFS